MGQAVSPAKSERSHLYEAKIRNMGNAGRNGGEDYAPRPLIRAMVQVVAPKIGARIHDGACGSAGFLCESFEYLKRGRTFSPAREGGVSPLTTSSSPIPGSAESWTVDAASIDQSSSDACPANWSD